VDEDRVIDEVSGHRSEQDAKRDPLDARGYL
jgi:hypothetical protein